MVATSSSVLIGTSNGIARSTNNGYSWTTQSSNPIYASRLKVFGSVVYACSYQGLYRSSDNGATWTKVGNESDVSDVSSDVSVRGTTITIASSYKGVLRSTDDGATWTAQNAGFPSQMVDRASGVGTSVFATTNFPVDQRSLVNRQSEGGGSSSNLYLTTNSGQRWSLVKIAFDGGSTIDTISYANDMLTVGNTILVGNNYGLFRSTDEGNTWFRDTTSFLRNNGVRYLNKSGNALYAIYYGGFGRSTDNGVTWTNIDFSPSNANEAASLKKGMSDARLTTTSTQGGSVYQVAEIGNAMFVASSGNVYRTTNGGSTWTKILPSGYSVATIGTTIFCPTGSSVSYSTDNKETWAESRVSRLSAVQSIAASGNELFAATYYYGLFVSKDLGKT